MLQLHSLRPWISTRSSESNLSSSRRNSRLYSCRWIPISTCHVDSMLINNREKWKMSSRMKWRRLSPTVRISFCGRVNSSFQKMDSRSSSEDFGAKLLMASLSSYFLIRLIHLSCKKTITKAFQESICYAVQTFGASNSPFACMSNSLSKPTVLQLDVSLSSFQDIRWNIARLIYLFNIQLERNVATFFVVLLVACFSFVVIGGFLFFKFRHLQFDEYLFKMPLIFWIFK